MKATVTVEVDFNPEEPELCSEGCQFFSGEMTADFCWLFNKTLSLSGKLIERRLGFPLRCDECLRLKEAKK
jgi:hypothetical protein